MIWRHVRWAVGYAASLGLMTGGCVDPGDQPPVASFSLQPVLPDEAARGAINLSIDHVRFRLSRPTETVLDTLVAFPPDSTRIALRLTVPLRDKTERFLANLQLLGRGEVLFEGSQPVEIKEGSQVLPAPIKTQYVGPGRDITSLQITPRDTVLAFGGQYVFGVIARNGNAVVAPPYYLSWETSNPVFVKVTPDGLLTAPGARGAVFLHVSTPSGARDSTRVSFAPAVSALRILSGDNQAVQVGTAIPIPLTVQAIGADDQQIPGVLVRFLPPTGGSVSATDVVTDAAGIATVFGISGPNAGPQIFRAVVQSPLIVADFRILAVPGPASALVKVSGDRQTAAIGSLLPTPFAVRVTDAKGNAIAGVPIEWQVLAGSGTLTAASTVTDVFGFSTMSYRLGLLPGPNSVLASVPGTNLLEIFTATATP